MSTLGIISTNKARCRDCYRCVRVCPVKAIRISDGQAQVDPERCLACGSCVRECPQQAKQVRSDLERVQVLVRDGGNVIASVAPSYIAAFPEYGGGLFVSLLKTLGFWQVCETAVGADMVARQTAQLLREREGSFVSSACPALVAMIAKYEPWAVEHITPIVSPMVAHARYLKRRYPDCRVVFVGPCPAKKAEAERADVAGAVDAVLTFREMRQWVDSSNVRRDSLRGADMDDIPAAQARAFPLAGGLAAAASMPPDMLRQDFAAVSGNEEVREMLDNLRSGSAVRLFEALFCSGGCVNGACFGDPADIFLRRHRVLQHAQKEQHRSAVEEIDQAMEGLDLTTRLVDLPVEAGRFSEAEIAAVLAKIGKFSQEDELNCGACGYPSCRANAMAVLSGMAEHTMCIPWMRKVAERKTDQIIDASPNGIVIVDSKMQIVEFNQAFSNMFHGTPALKGRPLSVLMDPADFEKVLARVEDRITNRQVSYPSYHITGSLNVYRLEDEDRVVGILANVTTGAEVLTRLEQIRQETLANAEQVIEKQMRMAQEIASILGETTSETRVLLRKLTEVMKGKEEGS